MPWGLEALAIAQKEDKPILLSIGYSSCHWCNRMSEENYQDSFVASIMNRHFICIKVDREERPDIDQMFMEAVRMFNQSAGWPLHAFCMPDGTPFWGGTFFPKEDTGQGIAPWPQVLMRIAEHYRKAKHELAENAKHATANLENSNHANLANPADWTRLHLLNAAEKICSLHDDEHGGFTPAPKFTSPMKIDFLLAIAEAEAIRRRPALDSRIAQCVNTTLENMAHRAIYDPLEGGFFRYALDSEWNSPHFEKMLSDNALLVTTFSKAFRKFKNPAYQRIVSQILSWKENNLLQEDGGYSCSLSAHADGVEGGYYLWTLEELCESLGQSQGEQFAQRLSPIGASKNEAYLPRRFINDSEWSERHQDEICKILAETRKQRPCPQPDTKRLLTDHALLARALVDAGIAFSEPDWIHRAAGILEWIEKKFTKNEKQLAGILFTDGALSESAYLEDYAFLAEALLSLTTVSEAFGLGNAEKWIKSAEKWTDLIVTKFKDVQIAGYYTSPSDHPHPAPVRKKFWFDNALPAGNSSLMRVFHTLSILGKNRQRWEKEYQEAIGAYVKASKQSPDAVGHALTAITEAETGIVSIRGDQSFIEANASSFSAYPHRPVFLHVDEEKSLQINGNQTEVSGASEDWIPFLYK